MTNKNHDSFLERFRDAPPDPKYTEILELHKMMDNENVPHLLTPRLDGYTIDVLPSSHSRYGTAEQHMCSKGADKGLIEVRLYQRGWKKMDAADAMEAFRAGKERRESSD